MTFIFWILKEKYVGRTLMSKIEDFINNGVVFEKIEIWDQMSNEDSLNRLTRGTDNSNTIPYK